ncbi:hypothetical protein HYH02_013036 [Chlamydomonas schloesseri]|uniref:2'-5'-oligoadenylate synthetase 1 domain-containing protein n=1 Tax=Chlamydomonas schloesseri TaxID=2026947 RepID=A0A835SUZ3_9CHLO|nr:hypothetical protein HYH02_013036 [Chlamydomonas schloesseri]|eukprot:KAG2432316.1 hypothetical protein HYH02_013036 [Chlamydomonas schloesseri]
MAYFDFDDWRSALEDEDNSSNSWEDYDDDIIDDIDLHDWPNRFRQFLTSRVEAQLLAPLPRGLGAAVAASAAAPHLRQVFPPVSPDDPHRVLKLMRLDLSPGGDKAYVRHFNGQLRPLTVQGVCNAQPQAANALIHRLLVQCPLIKVDRFHKGGSFGRRTLVRGAFDVDLSVFVIRFRDRALKAADWSGAGGDTLQRDLQRAVAGYMRAQGLPHVLEVEQGTHYKHCINVKVQGVDVDIKMAAHVVQGSQQVTTTDRGKAQRDALMAALWDTPAAQRRADPAREAALSEALTAVVKDTSDRVKSVARLVKCWYKHSLQRRIPHVPSVLLEVLTLAAAQRKALLRPGKQNRTAEVAMFLAALELLHAAASGREVVVLEADPKWGYTRVQADSCAHVWRGDAVKVLHPIDPTCNLAAPQPGRPVDWAALAREALELKRVVETESMWALEERSSLAPALAALKAAA